MTATDLGTLRELARLARLALTEEELARFAPELERVLAAFEVLGRYSAPAGGPNPDSAGNAGPSRARGDEPLPSLAREALLAAASTSEDGFYVVPRTVGGER